MKIIGAQQAGNDDATPLQLCFSISPGDKDLVCAVESDAVFVMLVGVCFHASVVTAPKYANV